MALPSEGQARAGDEADKHETPPEAQAPVHARSKNIFDFLRLIAAMTVIAGHSFTHYEIPILGRMVNGKFEPGMYWFMDGVPLFFILSGFLVFRSCEKCFEQGQPLRFFYWNRFLRVVPAIHLYVFAVTAWLLVIGVIGLRDLITTDYSMWFLRNICMFPVVSPHIFASFGTGVINGSLWTIPVEVSYYIVVPVFVVYWRRSGAKKGSILMVALAVGGLIVRWLIFRQYGEGFATKLADLTLAPYLVWFVIGVLFGHYWKRLNQSYILLAASVVTYFAVRFIAFDYRETASPIYTIAFGVPLGYAVLWFGFNGWRRLNDLTRIGDVSYGIYIWHMIVVNSVLYFSIGSGLHGMQKLVLAVLTLVLSYLVAWSSWAVIEKRALQMKPYSSRSVALDS